MTVGRFMRFVAALGTGGLMLQTIGCADAFGTLALSLLENILLSELSAGLGGTLF